jgi:predicted signal transduction protein with EAL and GGDEF domain
MADSTLAYRAPASIDELVRTDLLHCFFGSRYVAVAGGFAVLALLCSLLWEVTSHALIIGWFVLVTLCTALRVALFSAWLRAPVSERLPDRWEGPYWITLVLSASAYGLGAVAVIPADSLLHQVLTLFVLIGMAGGAVSMYAAYRGMTLAAILLMMGPITLWLLAQGTAIHVALAMAVLLFLVATMRSTREMSSALERSFRLGHEMKAARDLVAEAVRTDELTGVSSRRAFLERAEQLVHYCQRNNRALCALVLDLDHFKLGQRHARAPGRRSCAARGRRLAAEDAAQVRCVRAHGRRGIRGIAGRHRSERRCR